MYTLKIEGSLGRKKLEEINNHIDYLISKTKKINLVINSDGGLLEETLTIIEKIENLKTKGYSFDCHIIRAESAAALFALVCNNRTLHENGIFCLHIGGIVMELVDIKQSISPKIIDYVSSMSKKHWVIVKKYLTLNSKQFTRLYYKGSLSLKPEELEEFGFAKIIEKQTYFPAF